MNLSSIRDFLFDQLSHVPQKLHQATSAVDAIEAALVELSKIGHQFMLVQATPESLPAPILYPKMLYNKEKTTIVEDPDAERRLVAVGWGTSPDGGPMEHPAPVTLPAPEVPAEAPASAPVVSKTFEAKKN